MLFRPYARTQKFHELKRRAHAAAQERGGEKPQLETPLCGGHQGRRVEPPAPKRARGHDDKPERYADKSPTHLSLLKGFDSLSDAALALARAKLLL
jgi:hypothetical protein